MDPYESAQGVNGDCVLAEDWKFVIAIVDQAAAKDTRVYLKVAPVQFALGCDLPQAGYAE